MNLGALDREQLEALLLDPASIGQQPGERSREVRLRHVLAAAHELLVRIAHRDIVGRRLLDNPALVKQYLAVLFAGAERELFAVLFLDAQLCVIAAETLFAGTLTQTSVYPREVVRRALHHNAASVVLAHNHPSGCAEPSRADELLTSTLKSALALIDVRITDHLVVAGSAAVSFAERGLL
ncbi:JAB domain-containing protein [Methylibium rhizosphaerae]|uniref:JAB domain-containing protein n=1 Tax=Methylibium rhizosphaerae TaxID=2570323 RepID=UPI00112DED89|nr:DNA repair protein RadC [Methylibium rhizosphaerae]